MSERQEKRLDNKKIRASISFPEKDYEKLETIAEKNKVSIAWVVREAVEQYITKNCQ